MLQEENIGMRLKRHGGKKIKSVQQQTMDSSHPGQQHWEVGDVKMKDGQIRYNKYDRPGLVNSKSKVDY